MGRKKAHKRRVKKIKNVLEWLTIILNIISLIYSMLKG